MGWETESKYPAPGERGGSDVVCDPRAADTFLFPATSFAKPVESVEMICLGGKMLNAPPIVYDVVVRNQGVGDRF